MGSTGVAASFAFVAGLGGAVQIATQGRLGDRIGSLEALTCAVLVGGATAPIALLPRTTEPRRVAGRVRGPEVVLLGGLMSVVIVLAITVAGPKIGIVATTAFLIVGQFTPCHRDRPLRLVRDPGRTACSGHVCSGSRSSPWVQR